MRSKRERLNFQITQPTKVAILGFGLEGQSVLRFLRQNLKYKNYEIWILDKNKPTELPSGVKVSFGKNYLKNLKHFDIVFKSPGISIWQRDIQKAIKTGAKFSSSTELFFKVWYALFCPSGVWNSGQRAVFSTVPPKLIIPETERWSSNFISSLINPQYPRDTPITSNLLFIAQRTTALIAAFIPGASPPVVKTAIRLIMCLIPNCKLLDDWLTKTIKERNKRY